MRGLHLFLAALLFVVCCQPIAAAHVQPFFEEHASEKNDLRLKNRVGDFLGNPPECVGKNDSQVEHLQWVAKVERSEIVLGQANSKDTDPTGLVNEGMRYYSLLTETFTTRDPAHMIDGPNEYCFVRQNPWTNFDALGLDTIDQYNQDIEASKQAEQGKSRDVRHQYDEKIQQDQAAIRNIEETSKDLKDVSEFYAVTSSPDNPNNGVAQYFSNESQKVLKLDDKSPEYRDQAHLVNTMVSGYVAANAMSLFLGPGEAEAVAADSVFDAGRVVTGNGKEYLGPYYVQLSALHDLHPEYYPNPDTTNFSVVSGDEAKALRDEFDLADLGGHHVHPITHGGPAIPGPEGLTFTGESTIKASQLEGLDLSFYSQYGKGKINLNIYQPKVDGLFQFGKNPLHTDATTFWKAVEDWQRANGLR